MTATEIRRLVREYEGIFLDHPENGILVSDRLGRRFCSGASAQLNGSPTPESISGFLSQPQDADEDKRTKLARNRFSLRISVSEEASYDLGTAHAVARLSEGFADGDKIAVVLHFPTGPKSWDFLWRFLEVVRAGNTPPHRISVEGRFSCNDDVKEQLADNHIVVQWPIRHCQENRSGGSQEDMIRDIAEYGIAVLFMVYVCRDDARQVNGLLKCLLPLGFYSGFSVVPDFQHPMSTHAGVDANSPISEDEYQALLVDLYQEFPHFDSLFSPVNELANNVAFGGWNEELAIPRHLQMAIHGSRARLFRHTPALGYPWLTCDEMLKMTSKSLRNELLVTLRREFGKQNQERTCQLLPICACTDGIRSARNSEPQFVCRYRRLFIEAFLWQKFMLQETVKERPNGEEPSTTVGLQMETGDQPDSVNG